MSGDWRIPADAIAAMLQNEGLVVSMGNTPPGRDLRAEGDRGATHIEVAIDATGRIRVTSSHLAEDAAVEPLQMAGRRFGRVRSKEESTTTTGHVESLGELRALLRMLGLVDDG